jgi:hypothetical protein
LIPIIILFEFLITIFNIINDIAIIITEKKINIKDIPILITIIISGKIIVPITDIIKISLNIKWRTTFPGQATFRWSVPAEAKCGAAQAGTPAPRLPRVKCC